MKFKKMLIITAILSVTGLSFTACQNKAEEIKTPIETPAIESDEETNDKEEGLVFKESSQMKFAKHFKIDYYEDGYKIITDASDREILIVPEGKEAPELDRDMLVLKQPIKGIGLYATTDASWFRPFGLADEIKTVTYDTEKWVMDEIIQNIESKHTTFVGNGDSLDYELLQSINPDLHLVSQTSEEKLAPKFAELGLEYLSMGAFLEDDPRGRMEWIKLVGALYNKDAEAIEFFDKELDRIDTVLANIEDMEIEKPNIAIIYFSKSKELFNITKPVGYQAMITELSGGIPYPSVEQRGGDMTARGNDSYTNEEFYAIMQEADIIIYDVVTGSLIQNMDDMMEVAGFVEGLKAIDNGKVFGIQREYWQSGDRVADIIEDLHEFIVTPHGEIEENDFYFLMK